MLHGTIAAGNPPKEPRLTLMNGGPAMDVGRKTFMLKRRPGAALRDINWCAAG